MTDRTRILGAVLLAVLAALPSPAAAEPAVELGWDGWFVPRHWTRVIVHPDRLPGGQGTGPWEVKLPGGQILRLPADRLDPLALTARVDFADPQALVRQGAADWSPLELHARAVEPGRLLVLRTSRSSLWRNDEWSDRLRDVPLDEDVMPRLPAADGAVTTFVDDDIDTIARLRPLIDMRMAAGDHAFADRSPEQFLAWRNTEAGFAHRLWTHAVAGTAPTSLPRALKPVEPPHHGRMIRLLLWVAGWLAVGGVAVVVLPRTSGRLRNATGVVMLSTAYAALALWYLPAQPPARVEEWVVREGVSGDSGELVLVRLQRVTVSPVDTPRVVSGTMPEGLCPAPLGVSGSAEHAALAVDYAAETEPGRCVIEASTGPDGAAFATVDAVRSSRAAGVRADGDRLEVDLRELADTDRAVVIWKRKYRTLAKPGGGQPVILKEEDLRDLTGFKDVFGEFYGGEPLERADRFARIVFSGGRLATERPVVIVLSRPETIFRVSPPDEMVYHRTWTLIWGSP